MWDSIFMADIDNFSEINENFDTIKTLLNSIRAQGILNTSDVDKLLSGINAKLEKINTNEDIDLVKIFLSDLKQNLEERHSLLISKFGAIESLFSNLLKNSSEMPKSSELKELFDIVATNLSVFSREVVSQKETLTDITLRLDAMRSDDSQKKDIIKNIATLRPDLERLNNGFDSIVLSLNDNFKTIIKTISTIDKTEYLDRFTESISGIEMSSNTLLSAIQLLDKKTEQIDDYIKNLITKDDIQATNQRLFELNAHSQELSASVRDLSERYLRIDNLAEKIDASVNIIAGLKAVLEEADDKSTSAILEKLAFLEADIKSVDSDEKFNDLKNALETIFKILSESASEKVVSNISKFESDLKALLSETSDKITTLQEAHITRVLNDINSGAEALSAKLNQTQSEIAVLCEKNFNSVFDNIRDLKTTVSQIDENSISANNAIFSSITDRLSLFETSLRDSLEAQEASVAQSSSKLIEQVENIKNLSNVLDYKMDSSVVEIGSVKSGFGELKSAVEEMLALDFVNTVKDLRVDLYAAKQELVNTVDGVNNDLSEKFTNDLYGKYELLISKLDSVEDEFKNSQSSSLNSIKAVLDNISSSIVDVLSYVSETKGSSDDSLDNKLSSFAETLKENSISYVETVRDIVDTVRVQVDNNLKEIEKASSDNIESLQNTISDKSEDLKKELKFSYSKLLEIQDSYKEIKEMLNMNHINNSDKYDGLMASAEGVKEDFETKLAALKSSLLDKISDFKQEFTCENADKVSEIKFSVENIYGKTSQEITGLVEEIKDLLKESVTDDVNTRAATLAKILENFTALKEYLLSLNNKSNENLSEKVDLILSDFSAVKDVLDKLDENVDGDMTRQLSIIESNFESLVSQITILFDKSDKSLTDKINDEFISVSEKMQNILADRLEVYKLTIEESFANLQAKAEGQSSYLQDRIADLNNAMQSVWEEQADDNIKQLEGISDKLKDILDENIKLTAVDYASFKTKLNEFAKSIETNNQALTQDLKAQLDDITKYIDSVIDIQAQEIDARYTELEESLNNASSSINSNIESVKADAKTSFSNLAHKLELSQADNLKSFTAINSQTEELGEALKEALNNSTVTINSNIESAKTASETASSDIMQKVELSQSDNAKAFSEIKSQNEELQNLVKDQHQREMEKNESILLSSLKLEDSASQTAETLNYTRSDIAELSKLVNTNKTLVENLENSLTEKNNSLKTLLADISAGELQSLDTYVENLAEQIEAEKQNVQVCKNLIIEFLQKELKNISSHVEKETDVIIGEVIEQFDLLKKSQADDIVNLTSGIEDIVSGHIYNSIEDLKSYLDIKTDNSVLSCKLDNLKTDMDASIEEIVSNLNKMLEASSFSTAMSDFRLANELLINSSLNNLNSKIESFIKENVSENTARIEEKLNLFDKRFVDTVVDKYEEIKLISNKYNDSFDSISKSLNEVITNFDCTKNSINERIDSLIAAVRDSADLTNKEVRQLNDCFENLRAQISSKSFDEAFQASINKQIASLEDLIQEQFSYIEDISGLCVNNLPDVTELNTIVKYSVLDSLKGLSEKLDAIDIEEPVSRNLEPINNSLEQLSDKVDFLDVQGTVERELKNVKSEIITQFLNIFNQISFVAEQEEILDFIQEKHDELITILSHIVTTSDEVSVVKDNIAVVDNKIDVLKDDIELINEKITAIISSDGDIDYVYSLQDLESDIANLRLVLNEMKENDHAGDFNDLINSTNNIYSLVESIKTELPDKRDLEGIAEDIVSISTRTNKLILASDESYKTLQDNLQDFKLVINDLDERTKNFAHESGMDRIDNKLNAINNMMVSGAKTNQVFNQVFEYLAEWVDNASTQINAISDRVETLDDIGQIKVMLADLKAEAEDNSESVELIEALGAVFDKQTKRISSLEAKLDKIIVENTINNKNNKLDLTPMEDTLNRFLVAMDEKMTNQQLRIDSLESKLAEFTDTTQLTKKVGGMDRQIAKLNKNIEKIASHVIEK